MPDPFQNPTPQTPERQVSLDEFEDAVGKQYGIPKHLRAALRTQESGGNDAAISPKGARGRYQVMPETAKKYGMDANDPYDSTYSGLRYLREKYDEVDSNITDQGERWAAALAGYHGGERQIKNINQTGNIASGNDGLITTDKYVDNIMRQWSKLARQGSEGPPTPADKPAPLVRVPKTDRKGPVLQKPLPSPFGLQTGADIVGQAQNIASKIRPKVIAQQAPGEAALRAYQNRSKAGQVAEDVTRGFMSGAEGLIKAGKLASSIVEGPAGLPSVIKHVTPGLPEYNAGLLSPAAQEDLARRSSVASQESVTAPYTEGITSAATQLPAYALAGLGGLPGVAGLNALQEDWSQPGQAALRTALNTLIPIAGSKLAGRVVSPITNRLLSRPAIQGAVATGAEAVGGGVANAIQTGLTGSGDPREMVQSGIIGGMLGVTQGKHAREQAARRAQIAAIKQEPLRAPSDIRPTTTGPTQITKIPQNQPESTVGENGPVSSNNPEPILAEGVELPPEWVNAQRGELAQMMGVRPTIQNTADIAQTPVNKGQLPVVPMSAVTPAVMSADNLKSTAARQNRAARQAQLESDRATMFETARTLADESGAKADEHFQAGRYGDAAAELTTQQSQIKEAIRNLPKTPEGLKTKSELTRQLGMIGNRLGEVRRASRVQSTPQSSKRAATTPSEASNQTVRAEPLLESVVNPEGGIPESKPLTPSVDFTKLAERQPDRSVEKSDLLTEIRRAGGIADDGDTSGELRRLGLKEGKTTGIINNKSGVSVDDMRAMMKSEGHSQAETVADFYTEMEDALKASQKRKATISEEEYYDRKAAEPEPKPVLDPLADPDARRLIEQAKTGEPGAVKRAYDELEAAYGLGRREVDELTAPPDIPLDLMTRTEPERQAFLAGLSEEEQRNISRMKGPELDAYLKRLEAERNAGVLGADTSAEEGLQQAKGMALANKERHGRVMAGEMAPKQPKLPAPGAIPKAERAADIVKPIEEQKPPLQEWRASRMREMGSNRITYEDVTNLTDEQLAKRLKDYESLQRHGATMDKGRQDHLDRLQREYEKRQPVQPEITPQEQKVVDRINQSGRPAPAEYWASRGGADRKTLDSLAERGLIRKSADGRYGPVGVESTIEGAAKRNVAYQEIRQEAAAKERADYASLTGDRKAEYDRLRMAGLEHGQAMEQSAKPKTVTHDNPAIDGKPIVGETKDGRVVVANPENKSGVSIVKDKGAQSVADAVKTEKPNGGLVSIAKLRERGLSDADILAASERGEISLQRGEPRINKPSELLDDGQGNKYVGASVRETPNEGVLIRGEIPAKEQGGAKFKAGDSVTWKSGKMELRGKVQGYDHKGNLMIRDEIGDTIKIPEDRVNPVKPTGSPKLDKFIDESERLKEEWKTPKHQDSDSPAKITVNARVVFRRDPNNPRAGVLYANEQGTRLIKAALSELTESKVDFGAMAMAAEDVGLVRDMVDYWRKTEKLSAPEAEQLRNLSAQLDRAALSGSDGLVFLNTDLASHTRRLAADHELLHVWQYGVEAESKKSLVDEKWLSEQPGHSDFLAALQRRGYDTDPVTVSREWGAYAATNDLGRMMGIDANKGREMAVNFLENYFDHIAERHGVHVLDRLGRVSLDAGLTVEEVKARIRETKQADAQTGETAQSKPAGRVTVAGIDTGKSSASVRPGASPQPAGSGVHQRGQASAGKDIRSTKPGIAKRVSETIGTAQALAQMGTPGFIARNIIQHFSSGAQALIDQPIASLIDRAVALKTGKRSTTTGNPLTNTAQWVKDYKEGVKKAFEDVKAGKATPGARIENVPEEGVTRIGATLGKILKYINDVPDQGAWNAHYKKALRDLVATEKPKLANMTPEEIVKRQDDIIKQSVIEANRATLKDKNWVSNTAGNVKNLLNKATMPITGTDKFGLGDFVLKYTQVPGAILKRGIEYSPLGIFDAAYKAQEFKGSEFRQREVVNALSRAVTGTGTGVGIGALMSAMGILVAPDSNEKQEWLEAEEGKRGFQINMSALKRRAFDMVGSDPETAKLQKGDVLVGIDWLQPWALQASVGASIYDQWKRGKDVGIGEAAMNSLNNFMSVAQDQTILNSIARQWKIAEKEAKQKDDDGRTNYAQIVRGVLREIAVGAAPSFMPGLVRQTRQVVDIHTRDTRAEIEKGKTPEGKQIRQPWYRQMAAESLNRIREGIPGASSGLPTKPSAITGEPRKTALGEFSAPVRAAKMLLPAPFARYNPQPVVREIDRLRESGATVKTTFPFQKQDKETDWIEPTRSVRSREQEYSENFARMSKDLIDSPGYQQMTDEQKAKAISGLSTKLEKQTWEGKPVNPNKVLMDARKRQRPRKTAADYLQERD